MLKNNTEAESKLGPETRSGNIKIHLIIMLATLGIGTYLLNSKFNDGEKSPFLHTPITPIDEELPVLGAASIENKSPLDKFYPKMEKYDRMSVEQFELQPLEKRLAFAQYLIDKTNETDIYESTYGSGPLYAYHIYPTPINPKNSDEVIVRTNLLNMQFAALQDNKLDRQKILSSVYYKTGYHTPQDYLDAKSDLSVLNQSGYIKTKYVSTSHSEMLIGEIGREKVEIREVSYIDRSGNSFMSQFAYVEFKNYDDTIKGVWLKINQTTTYDEVPVITDAIEFVQNMSK